jgi:hypothetical protein
MALAAYTPQPHKFNRFNKNGLFGRDRIQRGDQYRRSGGGKDSPYVTVVWRNSISGPLPKPALRLV